MFCLPLTAIRKTGSSVWLSLALFPFVYPVELREFTLLVHFLVLTSGFWVPPVSKQFLDEALGP